MRIADGVEGGETLEDGLEDIGILMQCAWLHRGVSATRLPLPFRPRIEIRIRIRPSIHLDIVRGFLLDFNLDVLRRVAVEDLEEDTQDPNVEIAGQSAYGSLSQLKTQMASYVASGVRILTYYRV